MNPIIITELGPEKRCARCGDLWPATREFYYKRGNGLHSYCKACVSERCRELRSGAPRKMKPYKRRSDPLREPVTASPNCQPNR